MSTDGIDWTGYSNEETTIIIRFNQHQRLIEIGISPAKIQAAIAAGETIESMYAEALDLGLIW